MSSTPFSKGYSDKNLPLAQYAGLVGIFSVAIGIFLVGSKRAGRELPDAWSWSDLALLGIGTHKLARMVTKDRVTTPFRAPFTKLDEAAGEGEVEEEARGQGTRRAVGELVSCPFCIAPWVAAFLVGSFIVAPRFTRFVGAILFSSTTAHFLHQAYAIGKEKADA